jgi:hypothetical protein
MFEETLYQKARDGAPPPCPSAPSLARARASCLTAAARAACPAGWLGCPRSQPTRPQTQGGLVWRSLGRRSCPSHLAEPVPPPLSSLPSRMAAGTQLVDVLKGQGIVPGIKVDTGLQVGGVPEQGAVPQYRSATVPTAPPAAAAWGMRSRPWQPGDPPLPQQLPAVGGRGRPGPRIASRAQPCSSSSSQHSLRLPVEAAGRLLAPGLVAAAGWNPSSAPRAPPPPRPFPPATPSADAAEDRWRDIHAGAGQPGRGG